MLLARYNDITAHFTPTFRSGLISISLQWSHNGCDGVSNHQPHECLRNRLYRRRSKKTSKFRVTGLCAGNSSGTDEFPAEMVSNAENVSIWWRHHVHYEYTHNKELSLSIHATIYSSLLLGRWRNKEPSAGQSICNLCVNVVSIETRSSRICNAQLHAHTSEVVIMAPFWIPKQKRRHYSDVIWNTIALIMTSLQCEFHTHAGLC